MKNVPDFSSRYQVERQLGEGAAGIVYLANDTDLRCKVVIKTLKAHAVADSKKVKRFHNEFNLLKNCQHPNVIRVYDSLEFRGLHFFTMEYLEGKTLHELIHSENSNISFETAIEYLIQIAQGLAAVHKAKLIHRDLKPANIFVTNDNLVKLLDFGIARQEDANFNLTGDNEMLGTLYYMSPEQNMNKAVDHRTDIYSFGVLAFEIIARKRPFDAKSPFELTAMHREGKIPSLIESCPAAPAWLDAIVTTCLQKKADRRYDSIHEILMLLVAQLPEASPYKNCVELPESLRVTPKHEKNAIEDSLKDKIQLGKLGLSAACLGFVVMFFWFSLLGQMSDIFELRTMFALRGPVTPPEEVVIVAVDELTYKTLGLSTREPFPRKFTAKALQEIHKSSPSIVFVDASFQKEPHNEEQSQLLIEALKFGPTVIARTENDLAPDAPYSGETDVRFSDAALFDIPTLFQEERSIVSKIAVMPKQRKTLEDMYPLIPVLQRAGIKNIAIPSPYDVINFYGPPSTIRHISMHKLLEQTIDLSGKLVLVGTMSNIRTDVPGAYDVVQTSGDFSNPYFGVEVHATIAANLIDGSFIRRLPKLKEGVLIVLFSTLLFLLLLSLSPRISIAFYFLIVALWFCATGLLFILCNFYFPGVIAFATVGALTIVRSIWNAYKASDNELRERKELSGF